MPLPKHNGETKDKFIKRCMVELEGEFPDDEQRLAICYKQFREAKMDLQTAYAEIIQEVGKRNAGTGAARIKKILELCQELLSSEVDDEASESALAEAEAVLEILRTKEAMKIDDGEQYPASAYAYVPDPEKPSTWKLRLWDSPTEKVTRKQLGAAAAALSPGGFRGQRADIPKEDLSSVKRRIRSEYRKLEIDDMPKWIKEAEVRTILNSYVSLAEASMNGKGVAKVIVIKPGFGNQADNHYYSAEMLARDYSVFEGAKMYCDHQTEAEESERPEGSIRQWVASLKNVRFEEGVGVVGDAVIIEPWLQAKLATLRDQDLLSEMGISIRAAGVGTKGNVEGKDANIVEKIVRVKSVDFVTEAGAGGGVLLYESDRELDVDIVSIETLRERRPDLVSVIETEVKSQTLKEAKKAMELEEQVKEKDTQIEALTKERDELQGKITEAEKAQRIAEAKSKIDEAISKSELPEVSKKRLSEKFAGAETIDGIEEAIKAETDYVNALKESSKPKNLGVQVKVESHDALVESFKRLGMNDKEAELAAGAR